MGGCTSKDPAETKYAEEEAALPPDMSTAGSAEDESAVSKLQENLNFVDYKITDEPSATLLKQAAERVRATKKACTALQEASPLQSWAAGAFPPAPLLLVDESMTPFSSEATKEAMVLAAKYHCKEPIEVSARQVPPPRPPIHIHSAQFSLC